MYLPCAHAHSLHDRRQEKDLRRRAALCAEGIPLVALGMVEKHARKMATSLAAISVISYDRGEPLACLQPPRRKATHSRLLRFRVGEPDPNELVNEDHVRSLSPCVWVRHSPPSSITVQGPEGGKQLVGCMRKGKRSTIPAYGSFGILVG